MPPAPLGLSALQHRLHVTQTRRFYNDAAALRAAEHDPRGRLMWRVDVDGVCDGAICFLNGGGGGHVVGVAIWFVQRTTLPTSHL